MICEWFWHIGAIIFYLLMALIIKAIKVPEINHFVGYKTKRSMLNQDTWKEANIYSKKVFWFISIEMAIEHFILFFIFDFQNLGALMTMFALKTVLVIPITEYHLKTVFDDNGRYLK